MARHIGNPPSPLPSLALMQMQFSCAIAYLNVEGLEPGKQAIDNLVGIFISVPRSVKD